MFASMLAGLTRRTTRAAMVACLAAVMPAAAMAQDRPPNPLDRAPERPANPLDRPAAPPANPLGGADAAARPPAGEGFRLRPRYQAGQRWSNKYESRWEANESLMQNQTFPANDVRGLKGSSAFWVLDAEDAEVRKVLMEYGRCVETIGTREQPEPAATNLPHSNKQLLMTRTVSPITGDERTRVVDMEDSDDLRKGMAALEESIKIAFAQSLMPKEAVPVGHRWTSTDVGSVFGTDYKGSFSMRLASAQADGDAVIEVLEATVSRGAGAGATMVQRFSGRILVHVPSGLVKEQSFRGTAAMETRNLGAEMIIRGPWTYVSTSEILPLKPPTPEQLRKYSKTEK